MNKLALAFEKLDLAMKNVGTGAFYGMIYHATLIFATEDFYLPVLESLSNYKLKPNLTQTIKEKI